MNSLWQLFEDELETVQCNCGSKDELYILQGEIICKQCLIDEEYEGE